MVFEKSGNVEHITDCVGWKYFCVCGCEGGVVGVCCTYKMPRASMDLSSFGRVVNHKFPIRASREAKGQFRCPRK